MPQLISAGPKMYQGEDFACPSVTAVLQITEKRYLDSWRSKVGRQEADRVTEKAQVFGTRVHTIAQRIADRKEMQIPPEMEPYADAVRGFLAMHVDVVMDTEIPMVSREQGFGGTADLYCRLHDGSYALVDWKTTRQLTKSHGHQLAAYALLARERGMQVQKRIAVRVKKEKPGAFAARSYADHAGDVAVFRACLALWHALDRQRTDPLCDWVPPVGVA